MAHYFHPRDAFHPGMNHPGKEQQLQQPRQQAYTGNHGQYPAQNHVGLPAVQNTYPFAVMQQQSALVGHLQAGFPAFPPGQNQQSAPQYPSSSSPGVHPGRDLTPDEVLPDLYSAFGSIGTRRSPRTNKGQPAGRGLEASAAARISNRDGSPVRKKGPEARTVEASQGTKTKKETKASKKPPPKKPSDDGTEESLRGVPWTDEDTTKLLAYLYGDSEDGDAGGGVWEEYKNNKAHYHKKVRG